MTDTINEAAPKRQRRKAEATAKSNGKPKAKGGAKSRGKAKAKADRPARKPRVQKEAEPCRCGCGTLARPGSKFLVGHDARFHGRIRRIQAEKMTMAELKDALGPGNPVLSHYKEALAAH